MIKYTPFLKLKQNEIGALRELHGDVIEFIKPLFDLPRTSRKQSEKEIAKRIEMAFKCMEKLDKENKLEFYLDNFDLDDDIKIKGIDQYHFILAKFDRFSPIPVLALDRNASHNPTVYSYLAEKDNGKVAIRLQRDDLEGYAITKSALSALFSELEDINIKDVDLLLDLRLIKDEKADLKLLTGFLKKASNDFVFKKVILSGSIIPAQIGDLIQTNKTAHSLRLEKSLWDNISNDFDIQYGDYGVVSPDYSDADLDPGLLRVVSTPKVFYTYDDYFFISRGNSLHRNPRGNKQFFDIADNIVAQPFARDKGYSYGDNYIYDRSYLAVKRKPKAGHQGSWVKAMVSAHISYIVRSL